MTLDPVASPGGPTAPEAVRRAYLRHESNARSVGQLCYLVAFFGALGTVEFLLFARGDWERPPELKALAGPALIQALFWAMTGAFALITLAHLALGYGLIRLQPWARWAVVMLTAIGLVAGTLASLVACLGRPAAGLISLVVGGAINGLILLPLLGPGASMVFSRRYRDVIRQTPSIRPRMHWLLKLLIGAILASVLGFVGYLAAIYLRFLD